MVIIDIEQLDRLIVFLLGVLFYWLIQVIIKNIIPDIKEDIKFLLTDKDTEDK